MQILEIFLFFLPAYVANMSPVIAKRLNLPFNSPLNEKKLGRNKTYRGLISGFIGALGLVYLQKYYPLIQSNIIDYSTESLTFLAFIMTFGALTGKGWIFESKFFGNFE